MSQSEPQVVWHEHAVSRDDRERLNGHRGCVIWFTGLSGSGKSTVANQVDCLLAVRGVHSFLLDGDNVRHGLCAGPGMLSSVHGEDFAKRFGLGFGPDDREENIRRVGSLAQLFVMLNLFARDSNANENGNANDELNTISLRRKIITSEITSRQRLVHDQRDILRPALQVPARCANVFAKSARARPVLRRDR